MEPIPQTRQAVDEFGPFSLGDTDLLDSLTQRADQVQELVPTCVGISLALISDGVTFTLVASEPTIAELDAVQYVDGGPCVKSVETEQPITFASDGPLDEQAWQLFAQATAEHGVASTLTLPVLVDGQVAGSVNLYAATADAFDAHHDEIARMFDAWAPGAVRNADLSFASRRTAEAAPDLLRDQVDVERAVGWLADHLEVDESVARERLDDAARRAGVSQAALARIFVRPRRRPLDGDQG